MDRVNTAGKGEFRIDLLGGPEVFPVSDQMNASSKGLVDIVMTFSVHTPLVPEVDTTGLSDISLDRGAANGYLALLDKAHEKMNVKVIGRTATAVRLLHLFQAADPTSSTTSRASRSVPIRATIRCSRRSAPSRSA